MFFPCCSTTQKIRSASTHNICQFWHQYRVRAVKEMDSKSIGLSQREFESLRCRYSSLYFPWSQMNLFFLYRGGASFTRDIPTKKQEITSHASRSSYSHNPEIAGASVSRRGCILPFMCFVVLIDIATANCPNHIGIAILGCNFNN